MTFVIKVSNYSYKIICIITILNAIGYISLMIGIHFDGDVIVLSFSVDYNDSCSMCCVSHAC